MASCSNAQSAEIGLIGKENMLLVVEGMTQSHGSPIRNEEDEDRDADIDFNPFLKETLSPEASSSLSSENEGLDDSNVMKPFHAGVVNSSHLMDEMQSYTVGDMERAQEEHIVHTKVFQAEACEELQQKVSEASCQTENAMKKSEFGGTFLNEVAISGKPGVLSDNDDEAICRRTRARYSLASFTLDELESFLQETDDDEDLQNVDDEEEYRKFLAAVLLRGDENGQTMQENGNVDEDDEDNDADFEIELEEALDSDLDDRQRDKSQKPPSERSRRRPETRQNRRQNASSGNEKKLLEQAKRPLRPLLPLVPLGPNKTVPTPNGTSLASEFLVNHGYISGFTPYQIGQLYCLIHEHVQLLIQIYSLCILDPSRQQIASQLQELILGILHKRDQVLAWRDIPYPADIFRAPYLLSSVSDGTSQLCWANCSVEPSTNNAQGVNSALDCAGATGDACPPNGQPEAASSQTFRSFLWMPIISGPVLSILDVAPLNLVKNFMDEMSTAVQDHRRRRVESSFDIHAEREPLFLLPSISYAVEVNEHGNRVPSSSSQPIKKSLAAALVETTKKQSVALVPKEVAKLAQKFFPLFNQALFPHKPPPVSVTNRVLFTDAEDELLALGMMEYNTDWKVIQERFLPCKSKHQIFVRQKNRCSSKAPENPIKAVRRMKTSPLTTEEMRCIQEGLKVYKLDWMSIWKFIVPHRDPSLLPRQWRTAMGIQKSYKQNAVRKEKRRIYEAERRRRKAVDPANWSHGSEKEDCDSGDDCIDDPEEAYVHEAFLADWRPGTSCPKPSQIQSTHSMMPFNNQIAVEAQHHAGNIHQYITQTNHLQHRFAASHFSVNQVDNTNPGMDNERLVKLAPNLPPVNLPRNVRVLSQSVYSHHHVAKVGSIREIRASHIPEDSSIIGDRSVDLGEDRFNSSGLHMHPLLFQVPVDGHLSHNPSNCTSSTSGSLSFFSGNQPQLNLSLFRCPNHMIHEPHSLNRNVDGDVNSSFSGIEFHPLLQRTGDVEGNLQSTVPGPSASAAWPPSPLVKANELDLEIHLSSTSRKAKDLQSMDKANIVVTFVNGENGSPCQYLESLPSDKIVMGRGSAGLIDDTDNSCSYAGALDDQSHPEIVMEQEELSDSEEEFEEQVEFEREEMADSEEEDVSGADIIAESCKKDVPNLPLEKDANEPQDVRDQTDHDHCGHDFSTAGKSCSPSSKLGLVSEPTDEKSSKSWLSLVSCQGESPGAVKDRAPLHPDRSCKKTKEPTKTETDSLMVPPVGRPHKRPCRNKKGSDTGLPVGGENSGS